MNTIVTPGPVAPLTAPSPRHDHRAHVVQFYTEDASLLLASSRFIGTALKRGAATVVIATQAHRDGLAKRLKARGLDTASAIGKGRYISLDAGETLARFMLDGLPDAMRFTDVVGGVITQARAASEGHDPHVVVFGEMVALLWEEGKSEAAIRLEQLWNELARTHCFSLRCAYPMTGFHRKEHSDPFLKICAEHSDVIPSESYATLTSEEERRRNVADLQQKVQTLAELATANEELRQSEERFRLLVQAVEDYAIFMLDPGGHVVSWNLGAERMKGYRQDEIVGKHFSGFYPTEDIQSGKPDRLLEIATAEGRVEDVGWRVRKDGSRFWGDVVITALHGRDGKLRGFSKVTRDITQRKKVDEALRELSGRLLRAQDEERRRLARELHDGTAQTLSALTLNLALLQSRGVGNDAKSLAALAESQALADQAGREIRNLSHLLHPPDLDVVGLAAAIRWYAQRFSERTRIRIDLDLPCDLLRLPQDVETALFRIAQESLSNIHRHSGSSTAKLRIAVNANQISLEVEDEGCGMPPHVLANREQAIEHLGIGIAGMTERIGQLGGRLEISSSSQGTTVKVLVPWRGDEAKAALVSSGSAES